MADSTKSVEIIFGIVDNTSSGLANISSGLSTFESKVGSVTQPLANLSTGLLKTEAAVIAVAAAFGGLAITNASKFESAQIDLQKVLDGDDASVTAAMKNFSAEAVIMSEKYGIAATDILQGFANFKQAGFEIEEALLLQVSALDLVIAGDVEAATATDILVRSIKGFGLEANEAGRLIEAMNNVSNQFATSLGELASGMSALSPTARAMGFSLEETAGILTPIIEIFGSGAEAANALKVGLLQLISDNPRVVKELKTLGISQTGVNGEMKSGKEIMEEVQVAFQGLTEKQQLASTAQLVGIAQTTKMSLVFSELEKVQKITAVAMEETGSVALEVALRLASAEVQVAKLKVSFTNLSTSIGQELLSGFGDVAGGVNDVLKAFRDVVESGGLAPLFDALDAQSKEFGTFLKEVAAALPEAFESLDFTGLLASFDNLKGSVGDLFGELDLTKPEDLAKALQSLVDLLKLMTNASAGVIDGLGPLIGQVVSFLSELSNVEDGTQTAIGNFGGLATSINTILPLFGFLAGSLDLVASFFGIAAGLKYLGLLDKLVFALKAVTSVTPLGLALKAIGAIITIGIPLLNSYTEANKKLLKTELEVASRARDAIAELKQVSEVLGRAVTSTEELEQAQKDGLIVFNKSLEIWELTATGMARVERGVDDLDSALSGSAIADDLENIVTLNGSQGDLTSDAIDSLEVALQGIDDVGMESIAGRLDTILSSNSTDSEKANRIGLLVTELDGVEKVSGTAASGVRDFDAEVEALANSTNGSAGSIKSFTEAANEVAESLEGGGLAVNKFKEGTKEYNEVMLLAAKNMISFEEQVDRLSKTKVTFNTDAEGVDSLRVAIEGAEEANQNWSVELVDGKKVLTTWSDELDSAKKPVKDITTEIGKLSDEEKLAIKNTHEMELTLQELSSNEKIAAMEFTARIKIAELEADAKKVEAVMESVGKVFEATGQVVESLVTGFDVAFTDEDRQFFKDQIQRQLDFEQEAQAIQRLTAEAEAEKVQAQAEALRDGLEIKIVADGLEPELEAFMFKILDRIQTTISGDKTQFLLGVGV